MCFITQNKVIGSLSTKLNDLFMGPVDILRDFIKHLDGRLNTR